MVSRAQMPLEHGLPAETAQANLQYIRRTLEAAGRLSSVSGAGMVAVGGLALVAVLVNMRVTGAPWAPLTSVRDSVLVWIALLVISGTITGLSMAAKARRSGQIFLSPVLRKAVAISAAPLVLGAVLSLATKHEHALHLLPVIWLGCYGAGLTSAGVISVSPVRWMGISFMVLAASAIVLAPGAGLALLALGFGGLHVLFGAYIHWRHDG